MKKQALIILSTMLLAACQAGVMLRSESSPNNRVSEVKLLQPLTVSPDTTRVFVQDGMVIASFSYANQYRPQCAFEVRDRKESEQIIRAGSFKVTRVEGLMNDVVLRKPVQVAAFTWAGMDDGGAPMVHEGYHFWLEQNEQGVRRMTCYGVFADMSEVEPPTMEEIRYALGDVAELVLHQ